MSNKRALRKNILSAALGGCLLSLMPVGATLAVPPEMGSDAVRTTLVLQSGKPASGGHSASRITPLLFLIPVTVTASEAVAGVSARPGAVPAIKVSAASEAKRLNKRSIASG